MSAPFNDEPTLEDQLGQADWVKWFGDNIRTCHPPYVFSVHGDWGSGKTSFLKQVHLYLRADLLSPTDGIQWALRIWGTKWKADVNVVTVWFEAWRFQHESAPVVALLQQMRAQLATHQKVIRECQKIAEVTFYSLLGFLDKLAFHISGETTGEIKPGLSSIKEIGERLETQRFETPLTSQTIRDHLKTVIEELVGKKGRLVILIDDLDRCQPEAAYKLLEGIKIYLNLPNCVFVLAMDQRQLERGIAQCLPGASKGREDVWQTPGAALQQAREYLEKICQDVWQLPLIAMEKHHEFIEKHLADPSAEQARIFGDIWEILKNQPYLPANARKLKAYANTLRRFVQHCPSFRPNNGALPTWESAERIPMRSRHARMLVIMSCLYQFHTELYRRLESAPRFYNQIREWAVEGRMAHQIFRDIDVAGSDKDLTAATMESGRGGGLPGGEDVPPPSRSGPPGSASSFGRFLTFPDPAIGNVFRIRTLIESQGAVTEDEVKHYLLRHACT